MSFTTRGERDNNPGNVRKSTIPWVGKIPGKDPDFETFATPEAGIRAIGKILSIYQSKHGLNTIGEIINRWAPPAENNTFAYIHAVCKECGIDPDVNISLRHLPTLAALVKAVIHHENGRVIYPDDMINHALEGLA